MSSVAEIRGLRRIRRLRLWLLVTLAMLPVLLAALEWSACTSLLRQAILLAWCGVYTATTLTWAFSRCPRCRHLFHSLYPTHHPLARCCRGCGLSLDGTSPDEQ